MTSEVIVSDQHSLYESTLSAEISASATTIKPVSIGTFQDGDIVYFSLEPQTSRKELCKGTWVAANAQFESCLRGLRFYGADTEVTANKQKHSKGAKIVVSNQHSWQQEVKAAINNAAIHAQVADLATLAAVTGMAIYDLRYVRDQNKFYYYDGAAWQPMTTGVVSTATTTTFGTVKVADAPVGDATAITTDNTSRLLSAVDKTDLTDSGDTTLHYHASDRARSNHTGTQTASTISDFAEVAEDTLAAAFAAGTHTALTITYTDASAKFDFVVQVDNSGIEVSGGQLALKADGVKDTHIDWGTGAGQVSLDDVPDGSSYIRIPATGATDSHIAAAAGIAWSKISKTGSSLADLTTAAHSALSSVLGSGSYHISSTEQSNLTSFHAEAKAFFDATDLSGAEAETLSAGRTSNASALHTHEEIDVFMLPVWKNDGTQDTGRGVTLGDGTGTAFTSYFKIPTGKKVSTVKGLFYHSDVAAGNIGYNFYSTYGANGEDFQNDGGTNRTFSCPATNTITAVSFNSLDFDALAAADYVYFQFSRIATGDTASITITIVSVEVTLTTA